MSNGWEIEVCCFKVQQAMKQAEKIKTRVMTKCIVTARCEAVLRLWWVFTSEQEAVLVDLLFI